MRRGQGGRPGILISHEIARWKRIDQPSAQPLEIPTVEVVRLELETDDEAGTLAGVHDRRRRMGRGESSILSPHVHRDPHPH